VNSKPSAQADAIERRSTSRQVAGTAGSRRSSDWKVVVSLLGIVFTMLGLSYAAVPLYQIFCQVTGFAGTTQRADRAPETVLARTITVRFDANARAELGWRFKPAQQTVDIPIGEETLAFYRAENLSDQSVTGTATFNVTPEIAGSYFSKIECFCFTEQTLAAGQSVDMPVSFYIDPEIVNDPDARDLEEITLSYTFFRVRDEAGKDKSAKTQVVRDPLPRG